MAGRSSRRPYEQPPRQGFCRTAEIHQSAGFNVRFSALRRQCW
jgi:hypothetical protein